MSKRKNQKETLRKRGLGNDQWCKVIFPAIGSKFNSCHDNLGQFCSGGGGFQFSGSGLVKPPSGWEETVYPFANNETMFSKSSENTTALVYGNLGHWTTSIAKTGVGEVHTSTHVNHQDAFSKADSFLK